MVDIIKVAFCIDKAYMQHLSVSLLSLLMHNVSGTVEVYLIAPPLDPDEKEKLNRICLPFGTGLIFREIDPSRVSELREHLHLSRAAYFRLFLPEILPDVDKIIYFDCDLVIEANLQELWDTDVTGSACAGWDEENPEQTGRLGLDDDFYINSGVMVINLDYWRGNAITEKCMTWLQQNPDKNVLLDQDAMNVITKGFRVRIGEKWNLNPVPRESIGVLKEHPSRVVHFGGPVKPWHKWYDFDLQAIYWKYISFTPWSQEAVLEEPRNFCQALSVANQYYKREDYKNACRYYQQAINFRVATRPLESLLVLESINSGHRHYNGNDYYSAAEQYQSCIKFWGYPVEYNINVYRLGQGILG